MNCASRWVPSVWQSDSSKHSNRIKAPTWAGYAGEIQGRTVMFSPYQREMVLYSGSLVDEHHALLLPTTATGRVPMYRWPPDLRWFVGQDIYARSLFVGCTQSTAQTILEDPNLDAYPISPSDAVTNEEF